MPYVGELIWKSYIKRNIQIFLKKNMVSFMKSFQIARVALLLTAFAGAVTFALAQAQAPAPVYIGIDEAYGIQSSTTPRAIQRGVEAAIEEINARGGVLGGRPLKILTTDNQSVSARGRDNFIELAGKPGLIAVLTGKYSPVTVETAPEADRLRVPLVSVWGAADQITDRLANPSYVFRLSLKDSWGVEAMVRRAKTSRKATRVCALLPNTAWGRSGEHVLVATAPAEGMRLVDTRWYNWGDQDYLPHLKSCMAAGGQALILVANEREGALVITQLATLPKSQRLPIIAHWGITGGVIHELAAGAIDEVDMQVIQTFTFINNPRPAARRLAAWIMKDAGLKSVDQIQSPPGSAHAYDMTHLLALAVNKARSTDGDAIRRALESLPEFDGAVRRYDPAFTPKRHDALGPNQVLFVRIDRSGALLPVK